MSEEKGTIKIPHNLILEARRTLSISGVNDIDNFDENSIVLFTEMGELTIKGNNLHISMLNVDTGELTMDGEIIALYYSSEPSGKGNQHGIFGKVFR